MIDAMATKTELRAMKNQTLHPIPKSIPRNGHITPKDVLSHKELNHLPANAIVKPQYFYRQILLP